MASSGRINGSVTNRSNYFSFYLLWSAVKNVAGNYSDVTVTSYWSTTSTGYGFDTVGSRSASITIAGNTSSISQRFDVDPWDSSATYQIQTKTYRVNHNNDGTCSVAISARANGWANSYGPSSANTTAGDCTASATVTLDTIPRASSCTFPASMQMNSASTITITKADSNFTHTLEYYFGSASGTIVTKTTGTSVSFTPPLSLGNQIPSNDNGTGTLRLITYNSSGTEVGRNDYPMKLTIDANRKPTISASQIVTSIATYTAMGVYVQGKSGVKVNLSATLTNAYGATVASWKTVINGTTYNGQSFTTGALPKDGTISIATTITDTRNRTSSASTSISVVPYYTPKATVFTAVRNATTQTTINCSVTYDIASVNSKNTKTFKYRVRTAGGTWGAYSTAETLTTYTGTKTFNLTSMAITSSYEIEIVVSDSFTGSPLSRTVSTVNHPINVKSNGRGVAIGKMSETDDVFEVEYNTKLVRDLTFDTAQTGQRLRFNGKGTSNWDVGIIGGSPTASPLYMFDWTNNRTILAYNNDGNIVLSRPTFINSSLNTTAGITTNGGIGVTSGHVVLSGVNHISFNHPTAEQQVKFENAGSSASTVTIYKGASTSTTRVGMWDTVQGSVWVYDTSNNFNINKPLYVNGYNMTPTTGSWTPTVINDSGTNPTVTYTYRYANYYKIGRMCFIYFYIRGVITNVGTTTAGARIGGLPFKASGSSSFQNTIPMSVCYNAFTCKVASFMPMVSNTYANIRDVNNEGASVAYWKVTPTGTYGYFELGGSGVYITE